MLQIKKIISTAAPFIGSLVGGSFGEAAGKLLSRALLGKDDASPEEIEDAIKKATPEQLIALKKIDADYKTNMAKLVIGSKKESVLDRKDARNREIAVNDHIPAIMTILLTIGFFSILTALLFYPVPDSGKDIFMIMLGALSSGWMAAIAYYFGSSSDSYLKTHFLGGKRAS